MQTVENLFPKKRNLEVLDHMGMDFSDHISPLICQFSLEIIIMISANSNPQMKVTDQRTGSMWKEVPDWFF